MMKIFAKIIGNFLQKIFIIDVCQGPWYVSTVSAFIRLYVSARSFPCISFRTPQINCPQILIDWFDQKWQRMNKIQKQSTRGVLRKRCSQNMQQIYRRTLMPKCDFNKTALQLYRNHTLACVFSCKFAEYFQNSFS